jgi:hypothetical protein
MSVSHIFLGRRDGWEEREDGPFEIEDLPCRDAEDHGCLNE